MPPIIQDYMSPSNTNGDLPSPDTILFDDSRTPRPFNFTAGKKYLLRIANIGGLACGQFHIQGTKLSVVEADGVQMKPKDADTIVVCAGQTYGVVVQGKLNPIGGSNWIVKMSTDMLTGNVPSEVQRTIIGSIFYTLFQTFITVITDIITINWVPAGTLDDFTLQPSDGQKLLSPVDNKIELATNQTYFQNIGTRIGIGAQPCPFVLHRLDNWERCDGSSNVRARSESLDSEVRPGRADSLPEYTPLPSSYAPSRRYSNL
jgi:iron transport multicopper oxidase